MAHQGWMSAALLTLCACASTAGSSSSASPGSTSMDEAEGNLMIEAHGKTTYAELSGNALKGPQVDVTIESGKAKGEAYGAPVELALTQGQVTGEVGSKPTQLQLQPTQGGLRAQGQFRGEQTAFSVSPNTLSGNVATCRYDLKRSNRGSAFGSAGVGGSGLGVDYSGERSCAGQPATEVKVTLPSGFERLAAAQQATILGVMLGRPSPP